MTSIRVGVAAATSASVLAAGASAALSERSPLVGTWRTDTISQADAERTLSRYGLSRWTARFRPQTPLTEPMSLVLVITPKEWDLYGRPKGKPRFEIDYDARYAVKGSTVDKIHSTGFTTLRWSVQGRKLTLRWLKTTEPPVAGIPDKVFQYALYMTRSFSRVG
jgi:hypothetical protein